MRPRALALLLLAGAAAGGGGAKQGHPHFEDGGVLPWFTKLADAQLAARREDKLVLIEYGREQ